MESAASQVSAALESFDEVGKQGGLLRCQVWRAPFSWAGTLRTEALLFVSWSDRDQASPVRRFQQCGFSPKKRVLHPVASACYL